MFVPVLLGLDLSALSVATSMHECFGIKSHAFGRYRCGISYYSSIMITHIEPNLLDEECAFRILVEFARKQRKPCLLIPTTDWYLDLVVNLQDKLLPYYTMTIPDKRLYKVLSQKEHFYQLLDKHQISHPSTKAFTIGETPEWNAFPCILKPSSSVEAQKRSFPTQKKVYVIDSQKQLHMQLAELGIHHRGMRYLLQPYINAEQSFVLSVFCQSGFGTRRASLAEVALEERGDSSRGNYSALLVRQLNEISEKLIEFCDRIGYEGIANFDIIRQGTRDYVLEMNPRMGRSSDYLRGAGHSVADFLFKSQNRSIPYPESFSSVPIYWRCIRDREVLSLAPAHLRAEIRERIKTNFAFSPFSYRRDSLHPLEAIYRYIHLKRRGKVIKAEQLS